MSLLSKLVSRIFSQNFILCLKCFSPKMSQNPTIKWDPFFGPDPLEGRINLELGKIPYQEREDSNQNPIKTFKRARKVAARLNQEATMQEMVPKKLDRRRSLEFIGSSIQPEKTFAAVVASSNSAGKLQKFCSFCKNNHEPV